MRAALQTRYGPPGVVRIAEVDRPTPGAHDLLVRVRATSVNRTDCGFRAGHPFFARVVTGLRRPRRPTLGNEFAGEVESTGSAVTSFRPGDRVFGYSGDAFGAHAECLVIPEDGPVATMPANATFEQAAVATEGAHYALSFIRAAQIRGGQDVLVNGATGGIGSAAVQILKSLGARVTAVCGTAHLAMVRDLGADRVIDYMTEDFTQDAQQYDVVLDTVGKSSFGRCKRILRPRGIYLSSELGPRFENPVLGLLTPLFRGRRVMFPIPKHDQAMVRYLGELMESGQFTPVIDRRYPLDEIVEAYRYVETGEKIGNVVITVA
jgi:NADPH:quinone reductase-like Zn-dependent oxidoreductase